jgi:hypothetical protein
MKNKLIVIIICQLSSIILLVSLQLQKMNRVTICKIGDPQL